MVRHSFFSSGLSRSEYQAMSRHGMAEYQGPTRGYAARCFSLAFKLIFTRPRDSQWISGATIQFARYGSDLLIGFPLEPKEGYKESPQRRASYRQVGKRLREGEQAGQHKYIMICQPDVRSKIWQSIYCRVRRPICCFGRTTLPYPARNTSQASKK